MCHAADYEGDYTDEDGNLVGTCRAGICYPYNTDYLKTAVETVQQASKNPSPIASFPFTATLHESRNPLGR